MAPPTRGAAGLRVERSGPAIAAWQRRRAILRGAIGAGWLHFNTASLNIYIIYISELAFISLVNESKLPGTAYTSQITLIDAERDIAMKHIYSTLMILGTLLLFSGQAWSASADKVVKSCKAAVTEAQGNTEAKASLRNL